MIKTHCVCMKFSRTNKNSLLKEVTNIFYICTRYHIRFSLILLRLCFCPPSPVPLLICFETEQFSLTLIYEVFSYSLL